MWMRPDVAAERGRERRIGCSRCLRSDRDHPMSAELDPSRVEDVAPSAQRADALGLPIKPGSCFLSREPREPVAVWIRRGDEQLLAVEDGRVGDVAVVPKIYAQ